MGDDIAPEAFAISQVRVLSATRRSGAAAGARSPRSIVSRLSGRPTDVVGGLSAGAVSGA